MNASTKQTNAAQVFRNEGFGWIRTTDIHVDIVVRPSGLDRFGVYIFHGSPAGPYWRNDRPLVRCSTLEEAHEKACTIYGVANSERFVNVIYL